MEANVGVLIIHGMGDPPEAYADKFIESLSRLMEKQGVPRDKCAFIPVHWSRIFQDNQDELNEYLKSASRPTQLITRNARSFVVNNLSDASSYYSAYKPIHDTVAQAIRDLEAKTGADKPLIIAAHSLGSAVISDYIYDRQKHKRLGTPDDRAGTAFQRMDTLKELVTFGSNIPLFRMAYKERIAIERPAADFHWHNFYSRFDVLGYPLSQYYTGPAEKTNIEDVHVLAGNFLTVWNWLSHTVYWENKKLHRHIVKQILTLADKKDKTPTPGTLSAS